MRFLLLNQAFYPDVASTGQHLADLALGLVQRGHGVTVVTSRRGYDDPQRTFPGQEWWRGIKILRVRATALGKGAKWRRAMDFASFLFFCAWRLLFVPRHDVVVALTSPPLIAFLGACLAKIRRAGFVYWVMDLNPDEAIAAGWLRSDSLAAKLLEWMSRFSLRRADKLIALDRFMRERILRKNTRPQDVVVIPPWSHDEEVRFDEAGGDRFRRAHGLEDKFVVMYSGNHSPCHSLGTLVEAAHRLADDPSIVFCFIGGGSEWRRLKGDYGTTGPQDHETPGLERPVVSPGANIRVLPYQPLTDLSASLSAADLHVVVMGDRFVGIVHPCKIYNILAVAAPVLYIGPEPSHVTEIFKDAAQARGRTDASTRSAGTKPLFLRASHGEVDKVVQHILGAHRLNGESRAQTRKSAFTKAILLPQFVSVLESACPSRSLSAKNFSESAIRSAR